MQHASKGVSEMCSAACTLARARTCKAIGWHQVLLWAQQTCQPPCLQPATNCSTLWPLLLLLEWLPAQLGPAVAPRLASCLPPGRWGGGHRWRPKAAVHVAAKAVLHLLRRR